MKNIGNGNYMIKYEKISIYSFFEKCKVFKAITATLLAYNLDYIHICTHTCTHVCVYMCTISAFILEWFI